MLPDLLWFSSFLVPFLYWGNGHVSVGERCWARRCSSHSVKHKTWWYFVLFLRQTATLSTWELYIDKLKCVIHGTVWTGSKNNLSLSVCNHNKCFWNRTGGDFCTVGPIFLPKRPFSSGGPALQTVTRFSKGTKTTWLGLGKHPAFC